MDCFFVFMAQKKITSFFSYLFGPLKFLLFFARVLFEASIIHTSKRSMTKALLLLQTFLFIGLLPSAQNMAINNGGSQPSGFGHDRW